MTLSPRLSEAAVNAGCAAITALCDGGFLRLYAGTQPASGDDPLGGDCVLLGELRFDTPAFGTPVGGVALARPLVPPQVDVLVTGQVAWLRTLRPDGSSTVFDGSVGTSAVTFNLAFETTTFEAGTAVAIDTLEYRYQKQ